MIRELENFFDRLYAKETKTKHRSNKVVVLNEKAIRDLSVNKDPIQVADNTYEWSDLKGSLSNTRKPTALLFNNISALRT